MWSRKTAVNSSEHCSCCDNYRRSTIQREPTALCYTVFSLPVKTNSDEESASAHSNRAVIPADSWVEHPSINIHTPSNRFQTYPKSEAIHRVPVHIFMWSESYPVLTSHDAFWDWHAVTGCFSQKPARGICLPLCLFHFTIRVTCWRVLLCPVASRDISADMITANGCHWDWVARNAPNSIFRLFFFLQCIFFDLESRHFG